MNKRVYFLFALFVTLASSAINVGAQGSLTFNVDTASQTLFFTGSDSGTPSDPLSLNPNQIGWMQDGWLPFNNQGVGLLVSGITLNLNVSYSSHAIGLFAFDVTQPATLTGMAQQTDYSWMFPDVKTILENSDGVLLHLTYGSGFASIPVRVVPEPSSLTLFGVSIATAAVQFRLRLRKVI